MNPSVTIPGATNLAPYAFNLGGDSSIPVRNELRGDRPPNQFDDRQSGYGPGSVWINGRNFWFCSSAAEGFATWEKMGASGGGGGTDDPWIFNGPIAFVDPVNGDNETANLNNPNRPFKEAIWALSALNIVGGGVMNLSAGAHNVDLDMEDFGVSNPIRVIGAGAELSFLNINGDGRDYVSEGDASTRGRDIKIRSDKSVMISISSRGGSTSSFDGNPSRGGNISLYDCYLSDVLNSGGNNSTASYGEDAGNLFLENCRQDSGVITVEGGYGTADPAGTGDIRVVNCVLYNIYMSISHGNGTPGNQNIFDSIIEFFGTNGFAEGNTLLERCSIASYTTTASPLTDMTKFYWCRFTNLTVPGPGFDAQYCVLPIF